MAKQPKVTHPSWWALKRMAEKKDEEQRQTPVKNEANERSPTQPTNKQP